MDLDSTNGYLEQYTKTESSNSLSNDGDVFQSFWVRYCTVVADTKDRKFMESQCRFVLYCGIIFYFIYSITS